MADGLKLGLAGIGTVGCGLLRLIESRQDVLEARAGRAVKVVAVSARNKRKKRDVDLSNFRFVSNAVALATDPEIDVFVELIGGKDGVAKDAVEAALRAGKHVVTITARNWQHSPKNTARR
jgi:homoserine dehydrogenase